jgi:serine phosphatase RsbU (regulator of sigma subunit)
MLALIDGLGHGAAARAVSAVAEDWLRENAGPEVAPVTDRLCERLRKTDGAAVGLCFLDHATGRVTYAGIGSTVLRFFSQHREGRLVSRDGIAGKTSVAAKAYSAQLQPGDLLLLYSDGVRTHFRIEEWPEALTEEPAVVARSVVLRFGKSHDDAACIAARWQG